MDITLNLDDGVPIYRQISNQIRYMVASGQIRPGEEVPPIRALALQLKVTPNTVVKAYGELEAAGVLRSRRGAGTYVSAVTQRLADEERQRIIEQRVDALLAEAHQLNFTPDEVARVLERRRDVIERAHNVEVMEQKS